MIEARELLQVTTQHFNTAPLAVRMLYFPPNPDLTNVEFIWKILMSMDQGREAQPRFATIILPTRPQPDTLAAIFILKTLGENRFPGIGEARVECWQTLPAGETEASLESRGTVLMDIGGGKFDHHGRTEKTTTTNLVVTELGVKDDPALAKLLEYTRRDDFYGKGTISSDPLDRAFGLSGLVAALNKEFMKEPARVVEIVLPLLRAHYQEEVRRTRELPQEFEKKLAAGQAEILAARQDGKKLEVVIITSESGSMSGYLRSQQGGRYDVVVQWLPDGHVNILTRPAKRVDLRSLVVLLRLEEATRLDLELTASPRELASSGRLPEIPAWYYDPATNSVQNGGLNPKEVPPTKISPKDFTKILLLGLSEQLWKPGQ